MVIGGFMKLTNDALRSKCTELRIANKMLRDKLDSIEKINIENTLSLAEAEKQVILNAMILCNNKKFKAAKMLGCSIKTLYNKLAQYSLDE
jgi:DNA-binding NtrC family response regulator